MREVSSSSDMMLCCVRRRSVVVNTVRRSCCVSWRAERSNGAPRPHTMAAVELYEACTRSTYERRQGNSWKRALTRERSFYSVAATARPFGVSLSRIRVIGKRINNVLCRLCTNFYSRIPPQFHNHEWYVQFLRSSTHKLTKLESRRYPCARCEDARRGILIFSKMSTNCHSLF